MTILEPGIQEVWLWQGADRALERELREAVNAAIVADADQGPKTLDAAADPVADAARAYDEFVTEAKARAVHCVLKPLGHKRWRELVAAHPPREDDEEDKTTGVNSETFFEALVPACLAEPEFDSDAARDEFLDALPYGEFRDLSQAAYVANTGGSPDPKPDLSSRLGRTSSAT